MQVIQRCTLVATLLWAVLSALTGGAAFAAESAGTEAIVIVTVRGDVRITTDGKTRTVKAGATVALPASIRTGAGGAIELRQGRTTISVAADTQLDIPATAIRGDLIERVVQSKGNVFYSVAKRTIRKLRVETPYLVAVVKGTQFNVAAQEESTTISLFEGLLEVRSADDSDAVDLKAGEIAVRHRKDKTIRVLSMEEDKVSDKKQHEGEERASLNPATVHGTAGSENHTSSVDVPGSLNKTIAAAQMGADISASTSDGGATATVDIGTLDADVELQTNIDLGGGVVSAGLDASVDLGLASADVSADVGIDLGNGSADLNADAGLDVGGAVTADFGADSGVDLSSGAADLSTDAGVTAGDMSVDLTADAGIDLADGAADLGVDAGIGDTNIGMDTSIDLSSGTIGADVNVGGIDLGLDMGGDQGIDLSLGGSTATDSGAGSTGSESGGSGDGLLGGLLGGLKN